MKNLKRRVSKIEKLKINDDEDDGYQWFFSRCVNLASNVTKGVLPSQQKGPSPEEQEEQDQLFRDYPEHAARFHEWLLSLSNDR
jgi:hypothetical protein